MVVDLRGLVLLVLVKCCLLCACLCLVVIGCGCYFGLICLLVPVNSVVIYLLMLHVFIVSIVFC